MIKKECKRRQTDFSSFMRAAALAAMRNRTYRRWRCKFVIRRFRSLQILKYIVACCDQTI